MSRQPRIQVPGGIYHVVARGNERRAIFRDDSDRERFLEVLGRAVARYGWGALSYCLMGNHYHLLVRTPDANLARGMRQLNGVYAQGFNRRHDRCGHLFQGRYGAVLVQDGDHLKAAVRYVVRNPIRAGLVEDVREWRWSSHAATCGWRPPGIVAVDLLLAEFHEVRSFARRAYRELVEASDDPSHQQHPLVLGDEEFVDGHLALVAPSPEFPRAHLRPTRPPLHLLTPADVEAIVEAHRRGYSMREIASQLGCGVTTVHRRITRYELDVDG
jgi:putative transposase